MKDSDHLSSFWDVVSDGKGRVAGHAGNRQPCRFTGDIDAFTVQSLDYRLALIDESL